MCRLIFQVRRGENHTERYNEIFHEAVTAKKQLFVLLSNMRKDGVVINVTCRNKMLTII